MFSEQLAQFLALLAKPLLRIDLKVHNGLHGLESRHSFLLGDLVEDLHLLLLLFGLFVKFFNDGRFLNLLIIFNDFDLAAAEWPYVSRLLEAKQPLEDDARVQRPLRDEPIRLGHLSVDDDVHFLRLFNERNEVLLLVK